MSDVSLEELLKSLEEAEETVEKAKPVHRDVAHMDRFLADQGIKVGLDRIPNYIVFYTYKQVWRGLFHQNQKATKIKFFRTLNKTFTRARDGRQRYYLLNAEAFDMTREGKLKAKHYDEKYQEKIKKSKSKKSKSTKKVQPKE